MKNVKTMSTLLWGKISTLNAGSGTTTNCDKLCTLDGKEGKRPVAILTPNRSNNFCTAMINVEIGACLIWWGIVND